jgi:preprotein translocase subunit SecF
MLVKCQFQVSRMIIFAEALEVLRYFIAPVLPILQYSLRSEIVVAD